MLPSLFIRLNTRRESLSFWLSQTTIPISALPTAPTLLLLAFADFKRIYVDERKKYGVFLRQATDAHCCFEIGRENKAESVGYLVSEYRRYAEYLYKRRKEVIYHFTRLDNLDRCTAEALLDRYEKRHELSQEQVEMVSPASYPETEIYELFAAFSERYGVFNHPVRAAMLIDFRDGKLRTPLVVRNISRAVCMLKLMEHYELIDRIRWKKLEESCVLVRADGKPIVPGYMRRVASKLYLDIRLDSVIPKKKDLDGLNLYDRMAYEAWQIMGRF